MKRLEDMHKSAAIESILSVRSVEPSYSEDNEVVLSFGQRGLWTLDALDGPSATYNIPAALRLKGQVNLVALNLALLDVLERHEPLRTVIAADAEGEPVGYVVDVPADVVVIRQLELDHIEQIETRNREANAILLAEVARPFDLARDIPLRALYIKITDVEGIFA